MAQIFDGKETPIRQAFSRIAWKIEGNEFKGNCPNDPLFRAFFSSPGQESGEFNYQCGKANKKLSGN